MPRGQVGVPSAVSAGPRAASRGPSAGQGNLLWQYPSADPRSRQRAVCTDRTRHRVRAKAHGHAYAYAQPLDEDRVRESKRVNCVSIDSAWLDFSSPKRRKVARDLEERKSPLAKGLVWDRHVNIVAGRATPVDRTSRLYAYVHKRRAAITLMPISIDELPTGLTDARKLTSSPT